MSGLRRCWTAHALRPCHLDRIVADRRLEVRHRLGWRQFPPWAAKWIAFVIEPSFSKTPLKLVEHLVSNLVHVRTLNVVDGTFEAVAKGNNLRIFRLLAVPFAKGRVVEKAILDRILVERRHLLLVKARFCCGELFLKGSKLWFVL